MSAEGDWAGADYGAAHSMDTSWFAVDADGRVARFDTGEDGAVPKEAPSLETDEFDPFLVESVLAARALAKRPASDWGPESPFHPATDAKLRVLFVVRDAGAAYRDGDPAPVEARFGAEGLRVLRSRAPRIVVTVRALTRPERDALAADADVVRLWDEVSLRDLGEDDGEADLFVYAHAFEADAVAGQGSYAREVTTETPLGLEDFPVEVRPELGRVRIPVRFAEQPVVQLADHFTDDEVDKWSDGPLRIPPEGTPERDAYDAAERSALEARIAASARARARTKRILVSIGLGLIVVIVLRVLRR
ncbi:MAG: hypothetical protein U0235_16800 [Polyangiaceae bacterium]